MTPAAVLTTLHSFDDSGGALLIGGLVQASDGTLYGTTDTGGSSDDGTIFNLTLAPSR
jgi:uncharacterized repeat protein (TIGR03803 family)